MSDRGTSRVRRRWLSELPQLAPLGRQCGALAPGLLLVGEAPIEQPRCLLPPGHDGEHLAKPKALPRWLTWRRPRLYAYRW